MNETEHDPEFSEQEVGVNVPAVAPNDIVPVGRPLATVAMHVVVDPAGRLAAHETVVVVEGFLTVKLNVFELPTLLESPR